MREQQWERVLSTVVKGSKAWLHSGEGSSRRSVMMAHFGPQKLSLCERLRNFGSCNLTTQGWLYVAAILDLYARWVVGWSMSSSCDEACVEATLCMALTRRRRKQGL